jgi:hypothetical protein
VPEFPEDWSIGSVIELLPTPLLPPYAVQVSVRLVVEAWAAVGRSRATTY